MSNTPVLDSYYLARNAVDWRVFDIREGQEL